MALALFFLLFALGGCLLALYVFLGHSWNFAATEIDDASGTMGEYLVVLYEGTSTPAQPAIVASTSPAGAESDASTPAEAEAGADDQTPAAGDADAATSEPVADGGAASASSDASAEVGAAPGADGESGESATAAGADAAQAGSSSSESENSRTGVRERIMQFFHLGTASQASEEEAEQLEESELYFEDVPQGLTLGDAYATYTVKKAETLSLYTRDPDHYAEGDVFIKGSYKIGVIGLSDPVHYLELQARIDSLYGRGATMVIAIVPRASMLAATHGVDIAIVTDGSDDGMRAYGSGETLYIESSAVGTIDAVILSPNHTVTAKTL